jgi:alpha-glucoside transport system permease protein
MNPGKLAMSAGLLLLLLVGALFVFEWMRDTEVNRGLFVLAALAIGVGGVFALFLLLDRFTDALPLRHQETVRPWMFVGPALGPARHLPALPRDPHDPARVPGPTR